ncbi:hypothetical protein V8C42DRAFT_358641 [Trichoderma barbatum]
MAEATKTTRTVLNYKGLDYQTEWLDSLISRATLKTSRSCNYSIIITIADSNHGGRGLSVTKNHTGFEYSVPAMMDADGTYVMDSLNIAEYLEKKYPEPSIRLHSPKVRHMMDIVNRVMITLAPNFILPFTNDILVSPHREYFIETRSALYGMSLEMVEATMGGKGAYDAAAPLLKELTRMLEEHPEGPFLLGSEPSYGDLVWVALMVFLQIVGNGVFEAMLEYGGNPTIHRNLLTAAEPWLSKNT